MSYLRNKAIKFAIIKPDKASTAVETMTLVDDYAELT